MSSIPKVTFTVADKLFYEPLDRYQPDKATFFQTAQAMLPEKWQIIRKSIWFHATPLERSGPDQGWKIHVSAVPTTAEETLRRVVPVLTADNTAFKFALDRRILAIVNSKGWHRGGSGKFMTIYPRGQEHFMRLIEQIHQATAGLEGPYILSDRRYKGSRVVFYRYGGLALVDTLNASGEKTPVLSTPGGDTMPDERQPYFILPEWVKDPFEQPGGSAVDEAEGDTSLKNGRYVVQSVLTYSNSGGVYLATDNETGDTVVIKEGRPFTNPTPTGDDAVALLRKEYRLLQKVEAAGIAPRPIDFFTDWEHSYLVEEYLGNVPTLRMYYGSASRNITLLTKVTPEAVQEFWQEYKRIFSQLARLLEILHSHGIVFMDLSLNNILVVGDDLKLIDFEGAFEPDVEKPTFIFTPGFVSNKDLMRQEYRYDSDYYAFGALMLACLMPVNGMLTLDPLASGRFLRSICEDFAIPGEVVGIIERLLDGEPANRMRPAEVITALESLQITGTPTFHSQDDLASPCQEVLRRTADHLLEVMTVDRSDRLFPADPKVYLTNPLSVAYGACGVAYALRKLTGDVPQGVMDWILRQRIDTKSYPTGLYLGTAGISWVLWELGLQEQAQRLLRSSESHPGLTNSPDIFYGLAGWGVTQLKFYSNTGDEHYLEQAVRAGEALTRTAKEEADGLYWPEPDGGIPLGFAHGSSGISLFYLYLYLATRDEQYLELGQRALSFDLANASVNPEGAFTWQLRRSMGSTMLPYLRYGTAGVGLSVVRYYKLLQEPHYRDVLDRMLPDLDRKYAIFPGRSIGLTGIGEFLLDLANVEGYEAQAEEALRRIVSGILLFPVESEKGLGFPGYELFRLSCDYATGSAGITLFLHRYLERRKADFLIDELFEREPLPLATPLVWPPAVGRYDHASASPGL